MKSRDDKQLRGLDVNQYLTSDCEPFRYFNASSYTAYAPCGIIANSLFNGKCFILNATLILNTKFGSLIERSR